MVHKERRVWSSMKNICTEDSISTGHAVTYISGHKPLQLTTISKGKKFKKNMDINIKTINGKKVEVVTTQSLAEYESSGVFYDGKFVGSWVKKKDSPSYTANFGYVVRHDIEDPYAWICESIEAELTETTGNRGYDEDDGA